MKRPNESRRLRYILPPVALLLLPAVLIPLFTVKPLRRKQTAEVREGLSVLARLEEQDPADVDTILRERTDEFRRLQIAAGREQAFRERIDALEEGSVWEHFSDYLILGDSRALGFEVFHFLDPSRVLADGGLTIRDVPGFLDEIKTRNPRYVFLCFGLNDAGIGYWDTAEAYAAEMVERIGQLRQAAPDVRIVISSILPATESAMERSPSWRKIPAFSEAVRALCGSDGVAFADNDEIAARYMDTLWDEDGVHVDDGFYPYWAKNLLVAAVAADFSLMETESAAG